MTLRAFILAAMLWLAPKRDTSALGNALTNVIETEGCLVKGNDCERRSAALATYVAFRESGLRLDAEGDCDPQTEDEQRRGVPRKHCQSMCAFQIWKGSRALLTDAAACALAGYRRLRESLIACRGSIAAYAAGTCGSERGKRIDADRKQGANELLRRIK